MSSENQYTQVRREKAQALLARGDLPYKAKFAKSHMATEAKQLADGTDGVRLAGRLMTLRDLGKLSFLTVRDGSGIVQIALSAADYGIDNYKQLIKTLDLGDFVGAEGSMFTTRTGEKTLQAKSFQILTKSLRPLPEKFHGVTDEETRARQRYLDLLTNPTTWQRFQTRITVTQAIRSFLLQHHFTEVETPILQAQASGASARPFATHHNALDMPLYLRIAPETYLKRLMVGGYERVFEIAKCFRNEGVDTSHLQEFTMLEYYAAYWDYRDNMKFSQELLRHVCKSALGTLQFEHTYQDGQEAKTITIDLAQDWPEVSYRDLILKDTGIDLHQIHTLDQLKAQIKEKNLSAVGDLSDYVGLGALIDTLYKRYSRPKLIQPIFLTKHHIDLVPLARTTDENPQELGLFQLLIAGQEVIKAYSELVDPIEQRARLEAQALLAEKGDDEAMALEEDFIEAMEHGMPPMSGLGLGIDRLVMLLTNTDSIREVVFFPNLRRGNQ